MKILFITIASAPNEFSEGIVNSKLVLALKNAGHHIDIISKSNNGPNYSTSWNEPWLTLKENTYQIEYNLENKLLRLFDFLKCSIKFKYPFEGIRWINRAYIQAEELIKKNNYDVIITRSPSDIPHIIGLNLKHKYHIPWIANWNDPSNGIWPEPYKNNSNKIASLFYHYYTKKALEKADYNTFPCERLRNHFLKYFNFKLENTEIIPHLGYNLINEKSTPPPDKILSICHAGNLSEERDPEILFKAIAKIKADSLVPYLRFTIIGIATPLILKLINKYSLQNEIKFTGSKSYIETLRYMQNFDVLCIIEAKLNEGIFLPSKLSDYISLDKPILCFSPVNGTLVDIINKYGGGITVNNESIDSVYEGICKLISYKKENQLLTKIDTKGLKTYLSQLTIVKKYEAILCKLVNVQDNHISIYDRSIKSVKHLYHLTFTKLLSILIDKLVKSQKEISSFQFQKNILILVPHPDDEILGIGGFIIQCLQQEGKVHLVYLTDGGESRIWSNKDDIKQSRILLSEKVYEQLGLKKTNITRFHLADSFIPHSGQLGYDEVVQKIKQLIEILKPDAVFATHTHDYWPFDHVATAHIAREAVIQSTHKSHLWYYWVWTWYNLRPWKIFELKYNKMIRVDINEQLVLKKELIGLYLNELTLEGKPWSGVLPKSLLNALKQPVEIIEKIEIDLKLK